MKAGDIVQLSLGSTDKYNGKIGTITMKSTTLNRFVVEIEVLSGYFKWVTIHKNHLILIEAYTEKVVFS